METKVQNRFSATDLLKLLPEAFTYLTDDKQELSLAIYRNLAKGNPITVKDLKSTTRLSEKRVIEILGEWPGIYYDENNEIIGYWGLAIIEMAHKIEVDGKELYGWCAWDTLFIPQLLGQNATIRSYDHLSKEEIIIEIDKNGNLISDANGIYVSMLTVDEEDIQEDVITSFCHFIHFFKNESNAVEWTSKNDGTFLISLEEAIELSQTKNRLQYKNYIS